MASGTKRRPSFDISVSDGGCGAWLESAAASATTKAQVAAAEMREIERAFNEGSRVSEALHCSSRQSQSSACRAESASARHADRTSVRATRDRFQLSIASAEDATGRRKTDDQE